MRAEVTGTFRICNQLQPDRILDLQNVLRLFQN